MLAENDEHLHQSVNPASCREMGKDCRECISSTASITALLCPSMDAVGAQQTFFRLYRHEGCGGMSRAFVREYLSMAEPEFVESPLTETPFIERKPVTSAPGIFPMVAFA